MTPPLKPDPRTPEGRLFQRIFKLPKLQPQHREIIERAASEHHNMAPATIPANRQRTSGLLSASATEISLQRKPALANLTSKQLNAALLQILSGCILKSRRSHRELERELHLGHGTIGNIFNGRTELRLGHVEAIGKIFGLTLEQLLLEALGYKAPPAEAEVDRDERLAQLVAATVVDALRAEHTPPEDCPCTETKATPLPHSRFQLR